MIGRKALVIVDVQHDFLPGGALGVTGGFGILKYIEYFARIGGYDVIAASRDWHPHDHCSFKAQGGEWPMHCVQGTAGAMLHPRIENLEHGRPVTVINKGQLPHQEGYSAFSTGELGSLLVDARITRVDVCGLALDYCVKATCEDAALFWPTRLFVDATRPVDASSVGTAMRDLAAAEVDLDFLIDRRVVDAH